ncbi:MAG: nucleoside transporter C-terminal domain-containing protein [Bacteroidales bacterium]
MRKIWFVLLAFAAVIFFGAFIARAQQGPDTLPVPDTAVVQETIPDTAVLKNSLNNSLLKREVREVTQIKAINLLRGFFGLAVLIFIAWLFSANRKAVSWRLVGIGLGLQLLLAIGVLMVRPVQFFFEFVGKMFVKVLDFSQVGAQFLFGSLVDTDSFGAIFAFQILPTIIFFSALASILFYYGIIQKVVGVLAWLLGKALHLSGAESLVAAGNIFLGQTEAPFMIKAYLEKMNKSEILLVMIAGMATVAGGVLAMYIGFLGGSDPEQRLLFAKHLLAASVMAAPGAVVIAKVLYPQTEAVEGKVQVSRETIGSNVLDAIARGTTDGLKLAVNVAAMLLVFFALIALVNFVFLKVGQWTHLNPLVAEISNGRYAGLSLQFLLGYLFSPLMWAMGVCPQDMALVGQLAGEKLIASEFVGYASLSALKEAGAFFEDKSIIMATYMLCGFANFASVGIQIGGIGALAPGKRLWLTQFGMRALLGGMMASMLSATVVGMILG